MNNLSKLFFSILVLFFQALNAQWLQTNGPYGGLIKCYAVNGSSIFVGTDQGGIYRSTNDGLTWISVNIGLTNKKVFSLLVSMIISVTTAE